MTDAPPVIDTAFLAAAAAAELEDWGPLEEATSDDVPMSVRGLTIWSAPDDSGAEAGIWECTAGPSYWVQEENEVIYVLSGTLTVTPDGGKPVTLAPGDVAVSRLAGAGRGSCTRPSARSTWCSEPCPWPRNASWAWIVAWTTSRVPWWRPSTTSGRG